jgi:hypothetical protein
MPSLSASNCADVDALGKGCLDLDELEGLTVEGVLVVLLEADAHRLAAAVLGRARAPLPLERLYPQAALPRKVEGTGRPRHA